MNDVLAKVKTWLEEEIEMNQDVADAKDNKEDYITSDGTDDIIYGRHECATGLLKQIKKWESQETWDSLAEQGHSPQMIESILADRESDNE